MQTALKVQATIKKDRKPVEKTEKPQHQAQRQPTRPEPVDETETEQNQTDNEEFNSPNETDAGVVRVKICNESQLLATRSCPSWHTETFERGAQPSQYCNIHGSRRQQRTETETNTSPRTTNTEERDGYRMTPPPPILPDR
jgi:hypothetical protein